MTKPGCRSSRPARVCSLLLCLTGLIAQAAPAADDLKAGATQANKDIMELRAKVQAEQPDKAPAVAMQEEAQRFADGALGGPPTRQRHMNAAAMFLGFYWINTRTRPAFCQKYGVDITPFTSAFAEQHEPLLKRAHAVLAGTPFNAEALDRDMYPQMMPSLAVMMQDNMQYIASTYKVTLLQVCEGFRTNGPALAADLYLEKSQPLMFQRLLEAAPAEPR